MSRLRSRPTRPGAEAAGSLPACSSSDNHYSCRHCCPGEPIDAEFSSCPAAGRSGRFDTGAEYVVLVLAAVLACVAQTAPTCPPNTTCFAYRHALDRRVLDGGKCFLDGFGPAHPMACRRSGEGRYAPFLVGHQQSPELG